jgi:AraC-like DNA-binding protein
MGTHDDLGIRGILNPRGGDGRFSVTRIEPAPDLAPFVERHWIVRWDLRGRPPHEQETLPYPCAHLVIEAGQSNARGVTTTRFVRRLEGVGLVVGTKFQPGGFAPFVGFALSELTDRVLPLRDVFGATADGLEPEVLAQPDPRAQVGVVAAFLRSRRPRRDESIEIAEASVRVAREDRTVASVEQLAERAGVSPRTLQRLFRRYVGVSPKWVIVRFRIHEAAARLSAGTPVDCAALAQELGYFDQAHFIRDFKSQVGRSPADYAALCAEAQDLAPA